MAVFRYVAESAEGQRLSGTLAADSPADGRQRLRSAGNRILEFGVVKKNDRASAAATPPGVDRTSFAQQFAWRRSARRVAECSRHLALLLRSGIPLTEALDVLIRQAPTRTWQTILRDIRERVSRGSSFAAALREHPRTFDSLYVAAIGVGEAAGSLESVLAQLAEALQKKQGIRNRVTSALVYPAFLTVVGISVTIFLMTAVVPDVLAVLESSGRELPWPTRALQVVNDTLVGHGIVVLAAVLGLALAVAGLLRLPRIADAAARLRLRLPVLGGLLQKTLIARFSQQLTTLLRTGTPFVEALRQLRQSTRDRLLARDLMRIEEAVTGGSELGAALRDSAVFPPLVMQLVTVGQDSGELVAVLEELETAYEEEVNVALTRFTAILEPVLILVLATLIGFVILATLLPILDLTRVMR